MENSSTQQGFDTLSKAYQNINIRYSGFKILDKDCDNKDKLIAKLGIAQTFAVLINICLRKTQTKCRCGNTQFVIGVIQ